MISVLVADDHPFIRRGVRDTLDETDDLRVVAEAADGDAALAHVRELGDAVDVVVTDLSMPGLGGVELIMRLHAERPSLPVLALSAHRSDEIGLQVLQAGAVGYIEKREAMGQLPDAVRRVAAGGRVIGPDLADALARVVVDGADAEELSARELQVVRGIANGESRDEIAAKLAVTASTVSTYRTRALAKLGAASDADLTRIALTRGWAD